MSECVGINVDKLSTLALNRMNEIEGLYIAIFF